MMLRTPTLRRKGWRHLFSFFATLIWVFKINTSRQEPIISLEHLKAWFDHQWTILGPNNLHEWNQLWFQDFNIVANYNSSLFGIVSKLKFCGNDNLVQEVDLINKTLTTFHPSNLNLSKQYHNHGFKTHVELLPALLVAEQYYQVLLKNDKLQLVSQPTTPLKSKDPTLVESHYTKQQYGY